MILATHTYQKDESLYEMVIKKKNRTQPYLVLDNDTFVTQHHINSALTPSKIFFYLVKQRGGKIDITEIIEECLKKEIIEDWLNTQQ